MAAPFAARLRAALRADHPDRPGGRFRLRWRHRAVRTLRVDRRLAPGFGRWHQQVSNRGHRGQGSASRIPDSAAGDSLRPDHPLAPGSVRVRPVRRGRRRPRRHAVRPPARSGRRFGVPLRLSSRRSKQKFVVRHGAGDNFYCRADRPWACRVFSRRSVRSLSANLEST